jgi:hypothetical protein
MLSGPFCVRKEFEMTKTEPHRVHTRSPAGPFHPSARAPLAPSAHLPHISPMTVKARLALLRQSPAFRMAAFILGCLLMVAAPIAGPIPGPGGTILFAIGLGLALRSSIWAKRRYVKLKKQQPKLGGWADWGLRRGSAKRRGEAAKRKEGGHKEVDHNN